MNKEDYAFWENDPIHPQGCTVIAVLVVIIVSFFIWNNL